MKVLSGSSNGLNFFGLGTGEQQMAAETITCTSTIKKIFDGTVEHELEILKAACVCDTGDGTFSLAFTLPITGRIQHFVTDPGGTAPDANYDLVLTHPTHGYDLAGGALTNLAAATTELWFPEDGATNIFANGIWVEGVLPTLTAAQQTTVGAIFDLYIYILKG